MSIVFTFWEGPMPPYIELCMRTWKFPYVVLNYENLHNYTDLRITSRLKRFTLPQIADVIRVHVLRDQGGYWLDADTVMVTDKLPTTNMVGDNPNTRTNAIGYLYADHKYMQMFAEWAKYQDDVINNSNAPHHWSIMGNAFTDIYVHEHPEITIGDVRRCWPETYMINDNIPRCDKYTKFYFGTYYHLSDIKPTDMLMLHNSWTPNVYKKLTVDEIMNDNCTLSNILKEVVD